MTYIKRQDTVDRILAAATVAVGDTVEHISRNLGPHQVVGLGVVNASTPQHAALYVEVRNIKKDGTLGKYTRRWTANNVRKAAS